MKKILLTIALTSAVVLNAAVVKKEYPHDKAINYKSGDLRGAFVVEMVK